MRTPILISSTDDTVSITVQQRSSVAPSKAFRMIVPIDLTSVFHRVAPFPGVKSVANQTEEWDHVGPTRNPQFDDGSQVDEQLTEYTEGSSFAYQLTGFTNVLSTSPPASEVNGTSIPTAMARSSDGLTSSSRFGDVAGFSPARSRPCGADTWSPPLRAACERSKRHKATRRRPQDPASPTGECRFPKSSASPPPHPCSPRWPATPPHQGPREQQTCCWWSGCRSTCAQVHPSIAGSPRPPTPTKLPPTPAPGNGTVDWDWDWDCIIVAGAVLGSQQLRQPAVPSRDGRAAGGEGAMSPTQDHVGR